MSYLERAIADGHAKLTGVGEHARPRRRWLRLAASRLRLMRETGFETVPCVRGFPRRRGKLRPGRARSRSILGSEFNQAVEQACGNGTWAKFRANYVGVVAGMTRRFFDFCEKYGVLECEANIIADLPCQYGKPEECRFYKGDPNNDRSTPP